MMQRLVSRDETGVAVYMRVENLFTRIDPIGLGEYVDYPFEQKVFNCITTESQFKVVMCDGPIFDGSVFSDFMVSTQATIISLMIPCTASG